MLTSRNIRSILLMIVVIVVILFCLDFFFEYIAPLFGKEYIHYSLNQNLN